MNIANGKRNLKLRHALTLVLVIMFAIGNLNGLVIASSKTEASDIGAVLENQLPVADPQSITTPIESAVAILLSGSDPDGDTLSYAIVEPPVHGVLEGLAPELYYNPYIGFTGEDSFTFKVNDGQVESSPATVSISVYQPVNHPPTADNQTVRTPIESAVEVTLTGSDPDGDDLRFWVQEGPENGVLEGTAPDLVYNPYIGFTGEDSFTFVVNDWSVSSEPATVNITVYQPVNHPPTADSQALRTPIESAVEVTLTGSDPDGDELRFWVQEGPKNGVLEGTAPDLVYNPNVGFVGEDSFTFVVNDWSVSSEPATVNITVYQPVNHPPTADSQQIGTEEDLLVSITLTGSDPDGDDLRYWISQGPIHGTLSGAAPNLVYTPVSDYNGEDSFTFVVNDWSVSSEPAMVSITVLETNDQPYADDQEVVTEEDVAVEIVLTGSDIDGDELSYAVVKGPAHGVLSGTALNMVYTPEANYYGSDSFTFVTNDGEVDAEIGTVRITINSVNDIPVANSQSFSTPQDTSVDILLTGSDIEGETLSFRIVTDPEHGSLSGTTPNLTYTPVTGFNGTDSFSFVVNDGLDDSEAAVIHITVISSGPVTVFMDDFETNLGWTRNPFGTDTARSGLWERADPMPVYYHGYKQLGNTVSGSYDLVTGPRAWWDPGAYDVDYGKTSIRSPYIELPENKVLTLSLFYYLAHASNSSAADYLRITVVGSSTTTVLYETGAANDDDAYWASLDVDISQFAGQRIYLLIEAADEGYPSLVEAGVDDVMITSK